jgi:hypothetical protein
MDVDKVLQIKSWKGQWMFEVETSTVELDLTDVEVMGLWMTL